MGTAAEQPGHRVRAATGGGEGRGKGTGVMLRPGELGTEQGSVYLAVILGKKQKDPKG